MKVSLGDSEDSINSILDCTHPLAFTMDNYTIPAGATEFFANKRSLRLHGPVVASCGVGGYVTLRINNFGDRSVVLPGHTPVAQYCIGPEVAPRADMTVDDVVNAIKVDGESKEEEQRIRDAIREQLFKDREARRMYFSNKRIGKGAGVPPAKLELTEEFKQSQARHHHRWRPVL
ncbi:MAG: hypothetical protein SGPRY_011167 [Prymnesium sp.]